MIASGTTAEGRVELRGVRTNNLQGVDLDLRLDQVTALTGISGSGKTSLAIGTIAAEARRRFLSTLPTGLRRRLTMPDRPDADRIDGLPAVIAIGQHDTVGARTVARAAGVEELIVRRFLRDGRLVCPECQAGVTGGGSEAIFQEIMARERSASANEDPEGSPSTLPASEGREPPEAVPSEPSPLEGEGRVGGRPPKANVEPDHPNAERAGHVGGHPPAQHVSSGTRLGGPAPAITIAFPVEPAPASERSAWAEEWRTLGFSRLMVGDRLIRLEDPNQLPPPSAEPWRIVVDRLTLPVPSDEPRGAHAPSQNPPPLRGRAGWRVASAHGLPSSLAEPRGAHAPRSPGTADPSSSADTAHASRSPEEVPAASRSNDHADDRELRWLESLEAALAYGGGQVDLRWPSGWVRRGSEPACSRCDRVFAWPESERPLADQVESAGLVGPAPKRQREIAENHSVPQPASKPARARAAKRPRTEEPAPLVVPGAIQMRMPGLGEERSLAEALAAPVSEARRWFREDHPSPTGRELDARLAFLEQVGLGYLGLDRTGSSLSVGEQRRVLLTGVFASSLTGMLVVLDEPAAGLHPGEVPALMVAIRELAGRGNGVLLVEHDFDVLRHVDRVIEIGPGAGVDGGRIVFDGPPSALANADGVRAARWWNRPLAPKSKPRPSRGTLRLTGVRRHGLAGLARDFPLGGLSVVRGPSGSGKSTLIFDSLQPAVERELARRAGGGGKTDTETGAEPWWDELTGVSGIDEVEAVDHRTAGRSTRSSPATYLKFFDEIRDEFAGTLDARTAGLAAADFSLARPGGRCQPCQGTGLAPTEDGEEGAPVRCPDCGGGRYQRRIQNLRYRGLSPSRTLDLPAAQAFGFFRGLPRLQQKIHPLIEAGLGYLPIGRPLSTLSGGELKRLRLALALGAKSGRRTLFLLDEPTLGLHPDNVLELLDLIDALLAVGHTVIAVDNDPLLASRADRVIELGAVDR